MESAMDINHTQKQGGDVVEQFQQRASPPTNVAIKGEVAGGALPFNTPDGRPGLSLDDEDNLTFFKYTTYAPQTFDLQLGLREWGGRVRFMWQHGFEAGMTSIPIGSVTDLRATPDALMFHATMGTTDVAQEILKPLAAGEVKETSVQLRIVDFTFETDEEGKTFRRVTNAELFDVSLVVHGQFPQARLLEVLCEGCGRVVSSHDEHMPHGDGDLRISKERLGSLYAIINDLQEEITLHSCQ